MKTDLAEFVCGKGMIAAAILALLPLGGHASTLAASLTGPADLTAGESADFLLSWGDSRPSVWTNYSSSAQILVNGTVLQSFSLTPEGGSLLFTLALADPGTAQISAVGSISYVEWRQVVVGYQTYGYSCGSFFNRRTCYSSYPVYGWRDFARGTFTLDETLAATVSQVPEPMAGATPVPVPAALPLLAGGLALFGLMGRRRRAGAAV
jgi:hypothetical protein